MLPTGKEIETAHENLGRSAGHWRGEGEPPLSARENYSPEDGAGAVKSMQKDRSVARGRKRIVGHKMKRARIGSQWGWGCWML